MMNRWISDVGPKSEARARREDDFTIRHEKPRTPNFCAVGFHQHIMNEKKELAIFKDVENGEWRLMELLLQDVQ